MPITRFLAALVAGTVVVGIPAAQIAQAAPLAPTDPAPKISQVRGAKQTPFATTIKAGRKAVRAALKQTQATSVSVGFVHEGKTVWSQTFGRGAKAGKRPSPTAKYGVGSVSKTVTAVAIMQLVDQGKVSLDAPVARYISDFTMKSPQYRQITVRMLLNHSAGLPGSDYSDGVSSRPIAGYPDRVLAGLRNSHLKTTPGAMNVYCNDCYTLAGVVVERVSGMPFHDYVADNIFTPLRMRHSVYASSVPAKGTYAPVVDGGKKEPFQVTNIWASGGLLSTSDDMAQFAKVFTGDGVVGGKRILSSSAIEQMSVDQTSTTLRAATPGSFRYGLGWDSMADPALKSAGVRGWTKGGDIGQYHAGFVVAPDQRMAVVVEGAGTGFRSSRAETIAHTMLLNALIETGAIEGMPKQVAGKPGKNRVTTKRAKKQVRKITGIYLASGTSVKVAKAKNSSLALSVSAGAKWSRVPGRLVLRNDGAFWGTKVAASLHTVQAWDRTYLVQRSVGGTGTYYSATTMGQRTRSGGALSPAWRARVGHTWLLANEDPTSLNWTNTGHPTVDIAAIPGLSGYLLATGALVESVPFDATTSDTVGSMFLQVPLLAGRDLYDFEFTKRGAEEFLSFSSSVLRPAATVSRLSSGSNAVAIGAEGLVEWRKTPSAAVTLSGQSDWKLFDKELSIIGSGGSAKTTVQTPAGAYLAVFGPAGRATTVTVK